MHGERCAGLGDFAQPDNALALQLHAVATDKRLLTVDTDDE